MALLHILTAPADSAVLGLRSADCAPDDALRALARDMRETMADHRGWGLAAIQVGRPVRLVVLNRARLGLPLWALFNPVLAERSKERRAFKEGCLSMPRSFVQMMRHERVRVQFDDSRGQRLTWDLSGMASAVVQHEIDHLDGVVLGHRLKGAA